ncbi:MAG: cytochrome c-type biogenesis protein CcmH [Gammaproteobacteria bacterium]|nr:cytochrome c-type biogenesis protein CcmH [Gammaproteobacteria bacterium]
MRAAWLLASFLLADGAIAIDSERLEDPVLQQRYEQLTHELRCLTCQNETIADSNATLAAELRRELREMMKAGKTDAEIRAFLTERYGDFVLYLPPVTPRTWLLWAAPALLLLGGVAVAALVVRRRARTARADPAALEEEPENL